MAHGLPHTVCRGFISISVLAVKHEAYHGWRWSLHNHAAHIALVFSMLSMCNSPSHGVKIVMKCMHSYLCEKDGCLHTQNNSQLLLWDALQNHGTPSPHHLVQHPNKFWTWLDQNLVRKYNLKHCWSLNCLSLQWPWKSLSVVTAARKYLSGITVTMK